MLPNSTAIEKYKKVQTILLTNITCGYPKGTVQIHERNVCNSVCVCVCVRACVRASVRACVRACMRVLRPYQSDVMSI